MKLRTMLAATLLLWALGATAQSPAPTPTKATVADPPTISPPMPPPAPAPEDPAAAPTECPAIAPSTRPPVYPMALAEQGLSGVTLLMLEVDPCGAVAQVRVERSSGYAEFDQAAVEAAQGWRLAPAYQDGVAVPQRVRRPVRFELIEDLP